MEASMITFWQVLILIGIVSVAILAGVFIGAYVVFKTKREPHETLVGGVPKGEVFSIDNFEESEEPEEKLPETLMKRNSDFMNRFIGGMNV